MVNGEPKSIVDFFDTVDDKIKTVMDEKMKEMINEKMSPCFSNFNNLLESFTNDVRKIYRN